MQKQGRAAGTKETSAELHWESGQQENRGEGREGWGATDPKDSSQAPRSGLQPILPPGGDVGTVGCFSQHTWRSPPGSVLQHCEWGGGGDEDCSMTEIINKTRITVSERSFNLTRHLNPQPLFKLEVSSVMTNYFFF